ncbi:MAG: LptF/LptG family permease [Spirochaetaceae bacterium]|jgi:lipopolysaccharide export system permease protein|nr:LptF/LptG family permease [Spirochaetaceae bacterium]
MRKRRMLIHYVLAQFFPVFLGSLVFFALVVMLVDLMMNLWQYISESVPPSQIALVELYYMPKTFFYSAPISILFASSYTLSVLYSRNELLAIFASGIPLFTFTLPLLVFSLFLSAGVFFFDDHMVVPYYAKKVELQNALLGREKSLNSSRIVVISDQGNTVYKADYYDDAARRLSNVFVVLRNEDKTLKAIIRAALAVWTGEQWALTDGIQYVMRSEGGAPRLVPSGPDPAITALLTEGPETFRNNTVSVEEVTAAQARQYIDHLQRTGLPTAEARSVYYKKYSFPLIVFIVVFLSIGLSGRTRKNVLVSSLVFSITAAVLFYVTQMVTMLLAKFGALAPLPGAWAPVVFFILLSAVLVGGAKT